MHPASSGRQAQLPPRLDYASSNWRPRAAYAPKDRTVIDDAA